MSDHALSCLVLVLPGLIFGGCGTKNGTSSGADDVGETEEEEEEADEPKAPKFPPSDAPDRFACEADSDCVADTLPRDDGCCITDPTPKAHCSAYKTFVLDWRGKHCDDVKCPEPPVPTKPADCTFAARCVASSCRNTCPSDWKTGGPVAGFYLKVTMTQGEVSKDTRSKTDTYWITADELTYMSRGSGFKAPPSVGPKTRTLSVAEVSAIRKSLEDRGILSEAAVDEEVSAPAHYHRYELEAVLDEKPHTITVSAPMEVVKKTPVFGKLEAFVGELEALAP